MEYSDEYLREMLPRQGPPLDLVPGDVLRELSFYLERGEFDDRQLLARSVRWTYAIFSELGLGHYRWVGTEFTYPLWSFLQPTNHQIIVGLYDYQSENAGFGLCINVPGWGGPGFYTIGTVEFPRLHQSFPLALRAVAPELHAAPHPVNATATCWAQCNQQGQWGIVTAAHAVGTSLAGLSVPLTDGSNGLSHRSFWQPIDAAFVVTAAPSIQPSPLAVHNFPAAGIPVDVECRDGAQHRRVASACNSLGFYKTRTFPVLFFIDNPCSPGDSGALVRLPRGAAVGIYNGSEPSPDTGGTSGRVLNFAQAMFALDTTPYL